MPENIMRIFVTLTPSPNKHAGAGDVAAPEPAKAARAGRFWARRPQKPLRRLDRLVQLRRARSLRQLALDAEWWLASPEQLTQVESKFGEAISPEDMDGVDREGA